MKRRIPNTDIYLDTADFTISATPLNTDIIVNDSRFVIAEDRNGGGNFSRTLKGSYIFEKDTTFNKSIKVDSIQVYDEDESVLKIGHSVLDLTKSSQGSYYYTKTNSIVFGDTSRIYYENKKVSGNNIDTYKINVSYGDSSLEESNQFSGLSVEYQPELSTYYSTFNSLSSKGKGTYSTAEENKEFKSEILTKYYRQNTTSAYNAKEYADISLAVSFDDTEKSFIKLRTGRKNDDKYLRITGEDSVNIRGTNHAHINSPHISFQTDSSSQLKPKIELRHTEIEGGSIYDENKIILQSPTIECSFVAEGEPKGTIKAKNYDVEAATFIGEFGKDGETSKVNGTLEGNFKGNLDGLIPVPTSTNTPPPGSIFMAMFNFTGNTCVVSVGDEIIVDNSFGRVIQGDMEYLYICHFQVGDVRGDRNPARYVLIDKLDGDSQGQDPVPVGTYRALSSFHRTQYSFGDTQTGLVLLMRIS